MSDYSFLPHFITEDIYVIKEEGELLKPEVSIATEVAESVPAVESASVETKTAEEPLQKAPEPAPVSKPAMPVIEPAPVVAKEPEPVYLKPLPTEGNNLKHCLLLVESSETVLEIPLKGLLEKIMGAVKRSMDDVLLVNVKDASTEQIDALLSEQNHRHLIAFGTSKIAALNGATLYQLTEVNRKSYLKADSLAAIAQNVEMKKALWGTLKAMF